MCSLRVPLWQGRKLCMHTRSCISKQAPALQCIVSRATYSGTSLLQTSKLKTYTDARRRSQMVSHRSVYLLDLRIKDTSLFRIMDARSSPKRSYCIVNKLYNTIKAMPPSSIASASTAVQHGLSWKWLIWEWCSIGFIIIFLICLYYHLLVIHYNRDKFYL